MEHKIVRVEEGSIAEELEIEAGDVMISINGKKVEDVFDFRDMADEEEIVLLIRKPDGEEWELEIEKDPYEDLGLVFESDLMSDYRRCSNACVFCFVDQMPEGMRETLYFKDDDSRLSFLQGNYITLTNMNEHNVDRIIRYHLEPMNISIHTTNPELRCMMLKNRFAGKVLSYLDRFYEAGIHMNGQIVLCKGLNDREELHRTLKDLYEYVPVLESLSVVPVGLTKFRDDLYHLDKIEKEDAEAVIDEVEWWQKKSFKEKGIHFVQASDEFYLLCGRDFPEEERYDGYPQLENGVGMARLLLKEAEEELSKIDHIGANIPVSFATGKSAKGLLDKVADMVYDKFGIRNQIYAIRNDFFGENITVAGLITGQDLTAQLKDQDLGKMLCLPNVMFRSGEEVFLDDMTRTEVENFLKTPTAIIKAGGATLVRVMTGHLSEEDLDTTHGEYELPSLN